MATYYWVGGDGTWGASSTTNWSATSGGAGGAGVPNNTDTVIFDSASGTGTCTTASGSACATATLNSSTLGLTLGANHTMSGTFTLTLGALNLGSNVLTCNIFISSNSNVRSIAFGTGNITLTGNAALILSFSTVTNFTYTGTSNIICSYAGSTGTRQLNPPAVSAVESNVMNISVVAGTDIVLISGSARFNTLDLTGFAGTFTCSSNTGYFQDLIFSSGMTLGAISSTINFLGTNKTQKITTYNKIIDAPIIQNNPGATLQLQDNLTMGSTRTFTLTAGTLDLVDKTLSTGLFNTSNSNVRSIAFGTGNITLTQNSAVIWNGSTSTNLTVTGSKTINCTYSGATGTRTLNTSAALSETNAYNVNVTAGTDIISLQGRYYNLNTTGFTGTIAATSRTIFGSLTIGAGSTYAPTTTITTFAGTSGSHTITTNGVLFDGAITFNGLGGSWAFTDALTQESTRNFIITDGTVKLKNGVTSTVGAFATSGTNQKYLESSTPGSQATLSEAAGTVSVSFLNIKDINAVGGASWNAYTDFENVDDGNNDGWNFSLSPPYASYEPPIIIRSFTQPRRF